MNAEHDRLDSGLSTAPGSRGHSTHSHASSHANKSHKESSTTTTTTRENPKSSSLTHLKTKWKDSLRKECLNRAKVARLKRMKDLREGRQHHSNNNFHNRSTSSHNNHVNNNNASANGGKSSTMKRTREDDQFSGLDDPEEHNELVQNESSSSSSFLDCNNGSQYPPLENRKSVIEGMNGLHKAKLLQHCESISSANSEENVVQTAKALVEQELQRALMGLKQARQIKHQKHDGDDNLHENECMGYRHDGEGGWNNSDYSDDDVSSEDCKISHEEFLQLLEDVTEELQREDEMLEEELWEMERAEALERERMSLMIDDYEVWEEQHRQQEQQRESMHDCYGDGENDEEYAPHELLRFSSTVTNASTTDPPTVPCPICLSGSLVENPFDGIECSNAMIEQPFIPQLSDASDSWDKQVPRCTFKLDISHDGLTLSHLQNQLRKAYEEHSAVCTGILKFRMKEAPGGIAGDGMTLLMANCDVCCSDVVIL